MSRCEPALSARDTARFQREEEVLLVEIDFLKGEKDIE